MIGKASGVPVASAVRKTRRRFTDAQYQEMADVWNAAPVGQRNKAVRDLLGVSRQDATNYISRCRIKGFIEPSENPLRHIGMASTKNALLAEVEQNKNDFQAEIEQLMSGGGQ